MDSGVKKHGIQEQETQDVHLENIQRKGFSVFKSVLSTGEVELIKQAMYACYEKQKKEVGGLQNLFPTLTFTT